MLIVKSRRPFACVWPLILLALFSACFGSAAAQAKPPNVILVMTDDQGYGDLGVHGNKMLKTPQLDALARESIRFTNFHVDPTCAETRSALMTGRYSCRTGVWHTIMGRSLMRADETTMAEVFAANGYATGIFGKWHLGDNTPLRPQDRGFQEVLIHGGGGVGQTPDRWGNDYFDDVYFHNGKEKKFQGYCTDIWFQGAMNFIEANKQQPFFCYIPTNAAHGPYLVDPKYSQPYVDAGVPQPTANFYGMIANIDENMVLLDKRLKQLGLQENTILIFMTDNGTAAGGLRRPKKGQWPGFNAGMRGQKGSQYEGGHRVPLFVRWPKGNLGESRSVDRLTAHFDLLPTLIDLCQLKGPTDVKFDGTSLQPLLRNDGKFPERTLVAHSQRVERPEMWRKCSIMTEQYRLIDGEQLFDILADAGQTKNIADDHPDVVKALRKDYEKWWADVSTRFDEYVRIELGSPSDNPARLTCHDWHGPQVPWHQSMVQRGAMGNGFWAVDIKHPGAYKVTLRRWPVGKSGDLEAVKAKLQIGEMVAEQEVESNAESVTFKTKLPQGPAKLQTWLTLPNGKVRGAYFVVVEAVEGEKQE